MPKHREEAFGLRLFCYAHLISSRLVNLCGIPQLWSIEKTVRSGRCYSEDVLREYMKFCNRHGLHLLSDEIYVLSVWENPELSVAPTFKSVLSMDMGNVNGSQYGPCGMGFK